MSINAQYAATPLIQSGTASTGDSSFTSPSNANVGVVATAGGLGARIDNIDVMSLGTSTAGLLRLWLVEGFTGMALASLTSTATTATATTAAPHQLVTGDLITITDAFPAEYNVASVAVTVLSATTFTFSIVSVAGLSASRLGAYSTTRAAASYRLWVELPILATTGSTTQQVFNTALDSLSNSDVLPLVLPAGHSLRATVTTTQTNPLRVTARGGSF